MTEEQHRKVFKLLDRCCNYDNGHCLILDMPCPQQLSVSRVCCRYFRSAVLPAEKELYDEIMKQNGGTI